MQKFNMPAVFQIDYTNKRVMVSDDGGKTFERASPDMECAMTGKHYISIGIHDPLTITPSEIARVLDFIFDYHREDLKNHPKYRMALSRLAAKAPKDKKWRKAMQKKPIYERWDCLIESLADWLDANP
ncbi:hypothetical protein [Methylobacterium sp. 174MFSha1.1]|uniref:hypothetical protein n=1 Tax=Methylobacterium sp. 174MFSha1.1 TaxID=1502749 RepID=UPI0011609863|nr:hypothetical protein [Methylobacterium sp. 174MFSha1.1]